MELIDGKIYEQITQEVDLEQLSCDIASTVRQATELQDRLVSLRARAEEINNLLEEE